MKEKLNLTIGIPAYNEARNIELLVGDLLKQNQISYILEKILIISDGSNDNTVEKAKNYQNPLIGIIEFHERKGLAERLNNLIEICKSDCLVTLNADIRITDPSAIENLIQPIIKGADLVAGNIIPVKPSTFLENILFFGYLYKNNVSTKHENGDNYLTCHGPIRAFSKKLYKNLRFPFSTGEDAFVYLYCKKHNLKYFYAKNAVAYYRLPKFLSDHLKQTDRYLNLNQKLKEYFGSNYVKKHLTTPKTLFFTEGMKMFFRYPIVSTIYAVMTITIGFLNLLKSNKTQKDTWDIVQSSKDLK